MTELSEWLRAELQNHKLTLNKAAVYAGVGPATLSDILNKEHVPKVATLFRLADYFGTPREQVLRLAGHLPPVPPGIETPVEAGEGDEALIQELLAEFRRVPDEWKPVAVAQVAQFRRLAELRPARLIGEEPEDEGRGMEEGQGAGEPGSEGEGEEKAAAA